MKPICIGVDRITGRSVWLRPADLLGHGFLAGSTGMGKSVLASMLLRHCLRERVAAVFFDPHGDTYRDVIAYATAHRLQKRLVAIDANDAAASHVFPLNFYRRMAWIRQHRQQ